MCGWEFVPHTHTIHHEKERQRPNEGHTVFSNDQFAHVKKALKIKERMKVKNLKLNTIKQPFLNCTKIMAGIRFWITPLMDLLLLANNILRILFCKWKRRSFSVELKTLQSRGYDVETYVIGLVNGQEKVDQTLLLSRISPSWLLAMKELLRNNLSIIIPRGKLRTRNSSL